MLSPKAIRMQLACLVSLCIASTPFFAHAKSADASTQAVTHKIIIKFDRKLDQKRQTKSRDLLKSKRQETERLRTQAKSIVHAAFEKAGISDLVDIKLQRPLSTGAYLYSVKTRMPTDIRQLLTALQAEKDILYAVEDARMQAYFSPNDTRYNEQWDKFESSGGIRANNAWDHASGSGVTVAVIDTGYRPHGDLKDAFVPGYDFISDPETANDGNGRDANARDPGDWENYDGFLPSSWHGTHVSGIIGARGNNGKGIAGVAFNSQILPARVLGVGGGSISDIIDAIVWSAGGSVPGTPDNQNPARVLNLSLGGFGTCSFAEQDAISIARALGSSVVVAAGNSNDDAGYFSPGNCDGVITVAATNRYGHRASYSNTGTVVDIAAPGGETGNTLADGILSTLNDGTQSPERQSFDYYQGTSMAAPQVAGVAALMYEIDENLSPDQIECTIKSTARPFPIPESCPACGTGIVNADQAVQAVRDGLAVDNCETSSPTQRKIEVETEIPIAGNRGDQQFFKVVQIPPNKLITANTTGGIGDLDLFGVAGASAPTLGEADCGSVNIGNLETCTLVGHHDQTITARFLVHGWREFRDASLVVTTTDIPFLEDGIRISNLAAESGNSLLFRFVVTEGTSRLRVAVRGNNGDADLFVYKRSGHNANFVCGSTEPGSDETCVVPNPRPGVYDIYVNAWESFDGAHLRATNIQP